eukprot:TRINITY_DN2679_c0_g1_i1.p3 TRINITY_DN2679_c0_g1~~TRINITY_DN2679_c0_g1_i1.p3  ORF type:complete len:129 (+),score=20.29 TRINITY_DN2679_c0_g1_i1:553-939(+)
MQGSQAFHAHCMDLKGCAKCGGELTSEIVTAGDKRYHPRCFCCGGCGTPLTAYIDVPGRGPMCRDCAQNNTGMSCAGCRGAITSEYLTLGSEKYHTACFKCANCSTSLGTGNYFQRDGKPHCGTCVGN